MVVTGGRDYADRKHVSWVLGLFLRPGDTLVHGAARGADTLAGEEAARLGFAVERYPADWKAGKGAGHARNRKMMELPGVRLCVAFPGGRGTEGAKAEARKRGIEVVGARRADISSESWEDP